jgi:enoyl-CoA hydratase/carnithine racemase
MRHELRDRVATITLDRPERKNPLTFAIYAQLREFFVKLQGDTAVRAVVLAGAGGNFSSGGDVFEIIEPLTQMTMPDLLKFTRLTGDVVKAMRACPQPVVAAVDGVCAGAGAMLALASDVRFGTARSKVAFRFSRVGLSGADMGACALLPRVVGQGRAAELLYTGRTMGGEEGFAWGFFNRLCEPDMVGDDAHRFAHDLAHGPAFAHAMTKRLLHQAWALGLDEEIEAEAQAQAICMQTNDFKRAFAAFAAKRAPVFEGD